MSNAVFFDDITVLEEFVEKRRKVLKPAKNLRFVRPRVCAFCKFFHSSQGFTICEREGGFEDDVSDLNHFQMTCDGWTERTKE